MGNLIPLSSDTCPKCKTVFSSRVVLCTNCGFDFRTNESVPTKGQNLDVVDHLYSDNIERIDSDTWKSLGIGLVAAAVVCLIPYVNFLAFYFIILIHEAGHALCGFAFGSISLPAFDFNYGGGVTTPIACSMFPVYGMYGLLTWFIWLNRKSLFGFLLFGFLLITYAVLFHTKLYQHMIVSMGHGFELIIAIIFFLPRHERLHDSRIRKTSIRILRVLHLFL